MTIGPLQPFAAPAAGEKNFSFFLHALTPQREIPYDKTIQRFGNRGMEERAMNERPLPACPVETTLTLIGDKWKVLIIRDLLSGTKRFGELRRSVGGVSQKVLTAQLRQMESCGLLTRTIYPEVPPRVEYTLTELGRSLEPVLDALRDWGEGYKASLGPV